MAFPVDIEYVKRTEAKLGRKLPLGYVVKMCNNNGGELRAGPDHWNLYSIFDESDKKRLKRTCNNIVRETKAAKEWADFPENAVAIASNGSGDQLILLPEPSSDRFSDAVYWWDHETGEVEKVGDDFVELIEDD